MGCTGEALNDSYILTARHCVAGQTPRMVTVNYSEGSQNQPSNIGHRVDYIMIAPKGDSAILHLSQPHRLDKYVDLDLSYNPVTSNVNHGIEMGYGYQGPNDKRDPEALYQIKVSIEKKIHSDIRYGGTYIKTFGIDGYTRGGDSGGPLLVDNKLVGTLLGGSDTEDYYALLSENAGWIKDTAFSGQSPE